MRRRGVEAVVAGRRVGRVGVSAAEGRWAAGGGRARRGEEGLVLGVHGRRERVVDGVGCGERGCAVGGRRGGASPLVRLLGLLGAVGLGLLGRGLVLLPGGLALEELHALLDLLACGGGDAHVSEADIIWGGSPLVVTYGSCAGRSCSVCGGAQRDLIPLSSPRPGVRRR